MVRQVVDTPEFCAEPDPAFPVFMDAKDDIIRKIVRMHRVFFQMGYFIVGFIDNE